MGPEAYYSAHVAECGRYGVTPLDFAMALSLYGEGEPLECAFSVASDLDAGFDFSGSLLAWRKLQPHYSYLNA